MLLNYERIGARLSLKMHFLHQGIIVPFLCFLNGHQRVLSFGKPMIWIDPSTHLTNCYICRTNDVYSRNTEKRIKYAVAFSAKLPVPHSDGILIPAPPGTCSKYDDFCMVS